MVKNSGEFGGSLASLPRSSVMITLKTLETRVYGEITGTGKARDLVPDAAEQAAITDIIAMRESGGTLMGIRDIMRERGFNISHQAIANILARQEATA